MKGVHRLQGTINHEVAHHCFEMIQEKVLADHSRDKAYTPWGLDFLRSSGLTPENELSADYLALANGNQNQKKVHRLKGKPISDEQKRFSARSEPSTRSWPSPGRSRLRISSPRNTTS